VEVSVPDEDADDPYLWLEDVDSSRALRWVGKRNERTLAVLADDTFAGVRDAVRAVLDSADRIPYPGWVGDGHYYDFWTDAEHPRGLWRGTTAEQYRRAEPEWDVLLDIDALNDAEGANWVWGGAGVLRADFDRWLVSLSRGGGDAVVVREFDLRRRGFVDDGFTLAEAKSDIGWIDIDHVYVGTDLGPDSLTSSGYPRVVRRWRRGTALADAETVFEGRADDVSVSVGRDPTRGYVRDFALRYLDFFRTEQFLRTPAGELVPIDVPPDANWEVHREWLLIRPRSPWTVEGVTHPEGTLLAADFDGFLAGRRELTVLFEPDDRTTLDAYVWTRNHLLLVVLRDVRTEMRVLTPDPAGWRSRNLPGGAGFGHISIVETDPDNDDSYLVASDGFLQPATLSLATVGGDAEVLKREPSFFDAAGMTVRQFFATSADGTRVPYFVIGSDTAGPTLLTGYGGFEESLTPSYSGVIGCGWLARGGIYVVANIRGGGEYGPGWHRAGQRDGRARTFEDFAAVATDLVARGVTTPARLGIEGGSNGGLLMGAMLTRYPELFGAIVATVPLFDMRRYTRLSAGARTGRHDLGPDVAVPLAPPGRKCIGNWPPAISLPGSSSSRGGRVSRQSNLPERVGGNAPLRPQGAVPARRPPGPQIHSGRTLDFTDNPGRDHWWALLGPAVHRRIAEKVGPSVEWWAYCHSVVTDRPYAVVFGADGLAVTTPTTSNAGRPAHLLAVRRFVPASVRHAVVTQRPTARPPASSGAGGPAGGLSTPGLDEDLRGFLGNLPAEAQARMQAPFLSGDSIEDRDYFYWRTGDRRLAVWCYLAGKRTVMFVAGHRDAPDGVPAHAASWQLIVRMAEVAPR
jgi:prolyl oligopeptidase